MHTYLPRLSMMRTAAGCFFMSMKTFHKPALNVTQQLDLLRARGLEIPDLHYATNCLNSISYYRLSAYCKPLQNNQHQFKHNTTFNDIIDLYTFDRELRMLFVDAIERIEVAFRTAISNVMCMHYGPLWYLDAGLFKDNSRRYNFHNILLQNIKDLCSARKEDFLQHFYRQYAQAFPPSWMIIECLSFGTISLKFKNLKSMQHKKQIASALGLPCTILESWIEALVFTRNLCAHHSRLWNRWFLFSPKMPWLIQGLRSTSAHTIYEQILILSLALRTIHPKSLWLQLVLNLLTNYIMVPKTSMGFCANWQNDKLWDQLTTQPQLQYCGVDS